jgi:thiamine-phosphate pyrophosphorylase
MFRRCLFYYITDRHQLADDESGRQRKLLDKIAEAARCGVDYVQLREKDLCSRDLEELAARAAQVIRDHSKRAEPGTETWTARTRLLINSRVDIALAAGLDGVHLRSDDISPRDVRDIWRVAGPRNSHRETQTCIVAVSCHSAEDVVRAEEQGADFAVFAPVFGKRDMPETPVAGLGALREACRAEVPIFALGGVSLENAQGCLTAGAAGIAGIRLFQDNNMAQVVKELCPVLGSER